MIQLANWTSCAPPNMRGWIGRGMSIWITRAAACMPNRNCASTWRCSATAVFGNPHSKNLTSMAMTHLVEQAREYVLRYFNASPDEYMVIFTQNATGALKLVGESYPFGPGDNYLLTFDNHNSVNGIREFARARGATVTYVPVVLPDLRVDTDDLAQALDMARPGRQQPVRLSGSIQLHRRAASAGVDRAGASRKAGMCCWMRRPLRPPTGWISAAGIPTLSTSRSTKSSAIRRASGCLLVRKTAARKLRRPWYAGGTITFSSVVAFDHYLTPGPAGFEDGTVNYLSLPAVEFGLKYHRVDWDRPDPYPRRCA